MDHFIIIFKLLSFKDIVIIACFSQIMLHFILELQIIGLFPLGIYNILTMDLRSFFYGSIYRFSWTLL